ncbi:hypothetical protein [Hydrocoleum sp. CS-953]|uniref:hypothetical protein n=1 Tax=Microcoleaceae TaxID=1892252 RepID=UPI001AEFBDBA|nr:hypothetical protein [Hydrocoleum sp. CS-953]
MGIKLLNNQKLLSYRLSILSRQNPPLIPRLVYVENGAEKKVVISQQVRDKGFDVNTDS